jgi:hypothetical protein
VRALGNPVSAPAIAAMPSIAASKDYTKCHPLCEPAVIGRQSFEGTKRVTFWDKAPFAVPL